jgi:hypothetical protein
MLCASNQRLNPRFERTVRPGWWRAASALSYLRSHRPGCAFARPLKLIVRPQMSKWRYTVALPFLMSLSGCIEITTYVSPAASGTVIDAASKKPIPGATISVDDHPGLFAQTNSEGQFLLVPATRKIRIFALAPYESLPPGGTVVVSADGYAPREIVVNGSANSLLVSLDRVR